MKVAHQIAQLLKAQGIRHVFTVSGGANLHIIHAIADTEGIEYVCPQTEQAAGFAADAYARLNGIGCACATSGPGATNLITAIGASYYDSVPVLYLTGQVATFRMARNYGERELRERELQPRQVGFQETPIVEIVAPITKHAVTVMQKERVLYELQKAVAIAKAARMGPVLVDIPDDIQRMQT